jgi:cbb3-type cytochrome oxidase subunit 1
VSFSGSLFFHQRRGLVLHQQHFGLFFFISAAVWFLISSILGLLVSIKLHSPNFLAHCPWLTYGRIRPVQLDSLVYGFAASAAFGVTLWLFCRLGRTRLVAPGILLLALAPWCSRRLRWNSGRRQRWF